MCKLSLNQNLTHNVMIYNPNDDYFYLDGVKTIYRGYKNAIVLFANGLLNSEANNPGTQLGNLAPKAFVNNGTVLVANITTSQLSPSQGYTLTYNKLINFASYNKVTFKSNAKNTELVLPASGTGYISVVIYRSNDGSQYTQRIYAHPNINDMVDNPSAQVIDIISGSIINVEEITIQ
jgi:hypothetical protein